MFFSTIILIVKVNAYFKMTIIIYYTIYIYKYILLVQNYYYHILHHIYIGTKEEEGLAKTTFWHAIEGTLPINANPKRTNIWLNKHEQLKHIVANWNRISPSEYITSLVNHFNYD